MISRSSLPGGRRPGCEAGFTLIELLVVLAIVAMTIAVAAPILFGHSTGATLTAATVEVRSALRGARSTAIMEGRRVVFRGDAGDGYWLDRSHFTLPLMGGAQPVRVATIGGEQISFYPSGGSSGGRIVVTSGTSQREIAVDALTGRADAR